MTSPEDKSLQYWYKKARFLEQVIRDARKQAKLAVDIIPDNTGYSGWVAPIMDTLEQEYVHDS